MKKFQSSTRFLEFATPLELALGLKAQSFNPLRGSSSLQRFPPGMIPIKAGSFQSSTRFLEFATDDARRQQELDIQVSILYEVPRVCNLFSLPGDTATVVSILYEVPRVCNLFLLPTNVLTFCFNPLRGSSSLQQRNRPRSASRACSFNPLRGSSSLQHTALARPGRHGRVSILYEVPRGCNRRGAGKQKQRAGFNPLRGSSSLQPGLASQLSGLLVFQSSTRFLEFATISQN